MSLLPSEQVWEGISQSMQEAAERRQSIGEPRPDAGEHLYPGTNPQHLDPKGISGSNRLVMPASDWLALLSSAGKPLLHGPNPDTFPARPLVPIQLCSLSRQEGGTLYPRPPFSFSSTPLYPSHLTSSFN